MAWLARKAFWPARMPFPLVHVDTGHNFPETMTYRDEFVDLIRATLVVGSSRNPSIPAASSRKKAPTPRATNSRPSPCSTPSRSTNTTPASAAAAATRKRPAPRNASSPTATTSASGIPKNQRPELWNLFNGRKNPGEHFRVFPLSNFTEMDIWMYIQRENIPLPSIYFAHEREVFERNGSLLAVTEFLKPQDHEPVTTRNRPLPHHRRRHLHRRRRIRRLQPRRSHRRSRRRPPNRTRHPLRRQTLRNRHGRPEEGRIFLRVTVI